jgi:riboflavin synthase
MFTGIVRERGRLAADPQPSAEGGLRLRVACSPELARALAIGDSLAVSGVCLTIVAVRVDDEGGAVEVELSPETIARTTLGALRGGAELNLEPALRAGEPLGGHWVQGHVDGTLAVLAIRALGDHREVEVELPREHAAAVAEKGSVTLDGVSLTVASLRDDRFAVALIPHTLAVTTLGALRAGDRLNFEIDVLARYVQRALSLRGLG